MEKTPVEWLIDEAMGLVIQYMNGVLNEKTLDDDIYKIGTKAKEMEKDRESKIKELETFLQEDILDDVYYYHSPIWYRATELLNQNKDKDE